jgi:stage V sporulation protein R
MVNELEQHANRIETLARSLGLDYYPVDFEVAPQSLMTEIAVYGLPVRMPHWSFGVRYIHQLVRQSMGHSKIFEVMFPGDPARAFLMDANSLAENSLVVAHVLGHADFAKNNSLFARFHAMQGGNIVEQAASHAHRIQLAIEKVGAERVEGVLDAALALESHIDVDGELHRSRYTEFVPEKAARQPSGFQKRFESLPGESRPESLPIGRFARAFRRTRNTTCSGSSPTTRPSSSSGSATSSSWCAPSRCTSTRSSPARS